LIGWVGGLVVSDLLPFWTTNLIWAMIFAFFNN
jgi:hypothetical protein